MACTLTLVGFATQGGTLSAILHLTDNVTGQVTQIVVPITQQQGGTCTILDLTIQPIDLLLLGLSTYRAGHLIAYEKVAEPIRAPLTDTVPDDSGLGDTVSELELTSDAPAGDGPLVEIRAKTVSGDIRITRASAPADSQEVHA